MNKAERLALSKERSISWGPTTVYEGTRTRAVARHRSFQDLRTKNSFGGSMHVFYPLSEDVNTRCPHSVDIATPQYYLSPVILPPPNFSTLPYRMAHVKKQPLTSFRPMTLTAGSTPGIGQANLQDYSTAPPVHRAAVHRRHSFQGYMQQPTAYNNGKKANAFAKLFSRNNKLPATNMPKHGSETDIQSRKQRATIDKTQQKSSLKNLFNSVLDITDELHSRCIFDPATLAKQISGRMWYQVRMSNSANKDSEQKQEMTSIAAKKARAIRRSESQKIAAELAATKYQVPYRSMNNGYTGMSRNNDDLGKVQSGNGTIRQDQDNDTASKRLGGRRNYEKIDVVLEPRIIQTNENQNSIQSGVTHAIVTL